MEWGLGSGSVGAGLGSGSVGLKVAGLEVLAGPEVVAPEHHPRTRSTDRCWIGCSISGSDASDPLH